MLIVVQGASGGELFGVGPPAARGEAIRDGAARRRHAATALGVVSSCEQAVGHRAGSRARSDARFAQSRKGTVEGHRDH
jgi:hypothetical protein